MDSKIKNRIETQLKVFVDSLITKLQLNKLSPLLSQSITDFVTRPGKRLRPVMFIIGYCGFSRKKPSGLYETAIAIELLHDFMLVHDDIIDKSDTRRGKPSMHCLLNTYLKKYPAAKFNGQDLALVLGDVMYAMAIEAFLSINENPERKVAALKYFTRAAAYTGAGEFIELLAGIKQIEQIGKDDIYAIYEYKTSFYTFCAPLATGATIAGAKKNEIKILTDYGLCLGKAFQINDDILGMFGDEKKIGKSVLSDLQEAKKTLLIWRAFNQANRQDKETIKTILRSKKVNSGHLAIIKKIIIETGSLSYAENEIRSLAVRAQKLAQRSKMAAAYKKMLLAYPLKLLQK